jgi:DNA-binding NarL/FixJ family response regulator
VTSPIRVLVAEDSEPMRAAVVSLLQSERTITVVSEVSSYPDLLKAVKESIVDVILLDIRMPGLGQEVYSHHLKETCVVAMSFWADEETGHIAKSLGAMQLLDKAELVSTLVPAIQECVQQFAKDRLV